MDVSRGLPACRLHGIATRSATEFFDEFADAFPVFRLNCLDLCTHVGGNGWPLLCRNSVVVEHLLPVLRSPTCLSQDQRSGTTPAFCVYCLSADCVCLDGPR